jgi:hypothetical protein
LGAPRDPKETDVPNGIFPVPQTIQLRDRWRHARLDEELATGVDPASSSQLSSRAAQLQSPEVRSRLANAIVKRLGKAHEPNLGRFTRAGHRQHAEIREYADNLRALVERLRDDRPLDLQGIALTARLVDDRSSPLHRRGAVSLGSAVLSARLALDRSAAGEQRLSEAA